MKRWRQLAAKGALGRPKQLRNGALLFTRGEPSTLAYFLAEGAHEVFQESEDGMSVVVKVVTPPSIPGSPEIVAEQPIYLETIRIARGATVYEMTRDEFLGILHEDPQAALECLCDISQCFMGAAGFEVSRLATSETVLAALFVAYADVFGHQIGKEILLDVRRSQLQLAGAAGCTERSVNKVLAQWKDSGWVTKKNARYWIRDLDALKHLSKGLGQALVHRWKDPLSPLLRDARSGERPFGALRTSK
jgi:CRP-like cAMP-binding protein